MVKLIQKNNEVKKTVETDFILAHNLYARAEIAPTNKVILCVVNLKLISIII